MILTDKQFLMAGGAIIGGVFLLSYFGKKSITGLATGENALTEGTPYQGKGVVGTLGAAANELSGGHLRRFGEYIGQKAADILIDDTNYASPDGDQHIGN